MISGAHPQRFIRQHSHKRARSDPTTSSVSVEAIFFETVPVPEDHLDNLAGWCQPALAASARDATLDEFVDPPRWAKAQGLSALEKIDQLMSDVRRLGARSTNQRTEMENMTSKIADLETKLDIIAQESNSYLVLRNRFFTTYCRDIIGTISKTDREVVPLGNKKAYGGNITTDRRLYENGTRFDDSTFKDL